MVAETPNPNRRSVRTGATPGEKWECQNCYAENESGELACCYSCGYDND